jgi:hypothetical protein
VGNAVLDHGDLATQEEIFRETGKTHEAEELVCVNMQNAFYETRWSGDLARDGFLFTHHDLIIFKSLC